MCSFIILSIIVSVIVTSQASDTMKATLANVPEDGVLNFTELSAKYENPATEYDVTTEDGYILTLYNLPGDKRRPVLMLHGVFDTFDGWLIRGNRSLAIMLAREGYDIWGINFRGNRYSRRHTTLNPDKDSMFWDFSAHEYGYYDLAACIDFVLKSTGEQRLSIVAFSEGTTATLVLTSTRPEYNDKIKIFIALAPIAYLNNVRPALSTIIQFSPFLNFILPPNIVEVTGYYSLQKAVINLLCTQLVISYELCYLGGFNSVSGPDPTGIEREFFPIVIGHFPAGTSRKNLLHFSQIGLRQIFAQYDYGTTKNLAVYGSFTPPVYNLSKVTIKTVLVSAKSDIVSTLKDADLLKTKLQNVVQHIVLERETYNHLDHLWANDAPEVEYPLILDILAKYN